MTDKHDAPNDAQSAEAQQQERTAEVTAHQFIKPKAQRAKSDENTYERKGDPDRPFHSRDVEQFLIWAHLKKHSFAIWLPVVLSTVVLIVIIVQAIIYKRQLNAMDKQVELMRRQLDAQAVSERPYIIIKSAMIPNLVPNQPLSPVVTIANRGRTPAQDLNVTAEIAAQAGYIYVLGFPDAKVRPFIVPFLAAGDETGFEGAPADAVSLDSKFLDDAIDGKEYLIIHGKGSYKNLAGIEYPLDEYCFFYSSTYKQFTPCNPEMYGANRKKE